MKYFSLLIALFVLSTVSIDGQQTPKEPAPPPVYLPPPALPSLPARAATEIIAGGTVRTVKGAPFSAEGVSESIQTLADGNRITRSYTTRMYRDSEGRFRRESDNGASGSFATSGNLTSVYSFGDSITIHDPVENVRYSLNPKDKTARKITFKALTPTPGVKGAATILNGQTVITTAPTAKVQVESGVRQAQVYTQIAPVTSVGGVTVVSAAPSATKYESKTESLGTRSFDGVEAEGTRTVTTIPAGAIGNERPIETVYERWYSKELQLIVYSRNYDPRLGEMIYRLNNINRSEPDRALFAPPADYKIVSEPMMTFYTTKPQQ